MVPIRNSCLLVLALLHLTFAAEKLLLTRYIRNGNFAKAKEMATNNFTLSPIKAALKNNITSYSGFLTVNDTFNSNLFFLLFPAFENKETSSVILVLNSDPGNSLMPSIFLESGPFILDENVVLQDNNNTWAKTHTLIYIDSPVGTGFSFTDSDDGLASTAQDDDEEIYEAMKQIYTLFPEYQSLDLYFAGIGFAGRVIPRMVKTFQDGEFKFNTKGVIIGSPWLDPKLQVRISDVFLQMGLIDEKQSEKIALEEEKLRQFIDDKKYEEATEQMFTLYFSPTSFAAEATGFTDSRSILEANVPKEFALVDTVLASKEVHEFLHVGLHKFTSYDSNTFHKFFADEGHADVQPLEALLNNGFKVLIYAPQFDFAVPRLGTERALTALNWKGKEEFRNTSRRIWKVNDDVAGYVKTSGSFQYVMLRNAGFWAIKDQPKWCYDMVERFIAGTL